MKPIEQMRLETILLVRSGKISAAEGAKRLGVSRTTYYKWENRALKAMAETLSNGSRGRPGPTPEEQKLTELKDELRELRDENERLRRETALKERAWELKLNLAKGGVKKK